MKNLFVNCQHKDKLINSLSSSGSACAVIANYVIQNGGLVYGAMFSHNFKKVNINSVDNMSDYYKFIAKSKYVYSFMPKFSSIKKELDSGKLILVGALPCQIVALYRFLDRKYDNLITIALKCHGATDPKYWEQFVDRIEKENDSSVCSADFRPNHLHMLKIRFDNNTPKTYNINQFLTNDCSKCKDCKVKFWNEYSDFIVGDYWEYQKNKHILFDESLTVYDGISYLRMCSEKALNIFNAIKNQLNYKEFDISSIVS